MRPEQDGSITPLELANTYDGAWTFSLDGVPILIAGVKQEWPGRAIAWALVGVNIPIFAWRSIFKFAHVHLATMAKTTKRIEAYALMDWPQAVWSLEALGFVRESVMRDFTADGDYMMGVYHGGNS